MAADHSADDHISDNIRSLKKALALTAVFLLVETVGAFFTHSLALLSDASHMLSDVLALVISLYASMMTRRAPTAQKSYGYYRTEVLAALFNGLILFLMFGFISWEALHRFLTPVSVHEIGIITIGSAGLIVNLIAAWFLHHPHDLNLKGAYYHVILDAFGSVAAILAGVLIYFTGWYPFDPLLSMVIGVLVLYSSWILIRDSISILMESVPKHLDPVAIRQHVLRCDGVENIHDLHIWSIGSRSHALSAHIEIFPQQDAQEVRGRVEKLLRDDFHLQHTTLQMEVPKGCEESHD